MLFAAGETVENVYFIESGVVDLVIERHGAAAAEGGGRHFASRARGRRLQRISDGGVCGELGFFLQRPQVFRAVAVSPVRLWTLSRAELARMERDAPALCILVQLSLIHI